MILRSPLLVIGFLIAAMVLAGTAFAQSGFESAGTVRENPYTLDLGGHMVEVFRDAYGVPHVTAPSIEAAYRAQAYVVMEDRFEQAIESRSGARGTRALTDGPEALMHDRRVRKDAQTPEELREQVENLPAEQRRYLEAYVAGINDYIAEHRPDVEPWTAADCVAQAVYMVSIFGDGGEDEYDIYRAMEQIARFKGEDFVESMMDDALPLNVPNAPTTDHSADDLMNLKPPVASLPANDFDPGVIADALEEDLLAAAYARRHGLFTKWGSNAWLVAPERSASGNAMIHGGPMMGWGTPNIGAEVHLEAPGLNVTGLCFPGLPGIPIGHNERLAWTTTSGTQNQTDYFTLDLNPDDDHVYRYEDGWRALETHDMPIQVREPDGTVTEKPYTQYRSVHGPIIAWDPNSDRAYAQASTHRGKEMESWMAFVELSFAENFRDFEQSVRKIHSSHNFFAADIDGNIGYWLAGRLPVLPEGVDPRLPKKGDGSEDWQGTRVATDLARSINPEEGWIGNWNNKPSVNVQSWMPEMFWGVKILTALREDDNMTFAEVRELNRTSGQHNFIAYYCKPYLLKVLRERGEENPRVDQAIRLLEGWDNLNRLDEPAARLMDEWYMELMVKVLSPTYTNILIRRSLDFNNLRIFGVLTFRAMFPERAGIELSNDYMMGRDRDAVAYGAFVDVIDRLTNEMGPDFHGWSYDPGTIDFGEVGQLPSRKAGSYWFTAELSQPIRAMSTLPPGQSEHPDSPHYDDQFRLFKNWHYKELDAHAQQPQEFPPIFTKSITD